MEEKCYLVLAKQLLESNLLGVFTKREDAEEAKARLERVFKSKHLWCMATFSIEECPIDSMRLIEETINNVRKELGL